jgi:hypothetical protein
MGARTAAKLEETCWATYMPRSGQSRRHQYPIVLYRPGEAARVETKTKYISREGFYCISEHPFSPHEQLECEVAIPRDQLDCSLEEHSLLRCRVEVIRVVVKGLEFGFGLSCRVVEVHSINPKGTPSGKAGIMRSESRR